MVRPSVLALVLGALGASACGPGAPSPQDGGVIEPPSACATPARAAEPGACASDAECGGQVCRFEAGAGAEDLVPLVLRCGAPAGALAAGGACAVGPECESGLCVLAGTCVRPCGAAEGCDASERCAAVFVRTAPDALQPTFGCVPRFALPPDARVQARTVSAAGDEASFTWTPSSPGALAALRPACGATLSALRLELAEGGPSTLWSSARDGEPWPNPVFAGSPHPTVLVPNGSLAAPPREGLRATLAAAGPGAHDLVTIERDGSGGRLDLDLYYVGGGAFAPEGERGPPRVAAAIDALEASVARAGITVGEVRQHEVVGGLRDRYGIVDRTPEGRYPELQELFSLGAGERGPSVSIFFVRSVDATVALAGGVPGPAGQPGVEGSGVAIGVDVLASDAMLATALAHELGHQLGLFHTTEPDGRVVESLSDTPVCPREADADGGGTLDARECEAFGGDNLMFWSGSAWSGSVGSDSARALSSQQLTVLARSPLLLR